jgi:glycosyltransferase involved in cell wall biosynthesis
MVSIIIPSRNERFLPQTVDDIFAKATGAIEVIVVLDGYWPDPILTDRKNLILLHRGTALGMRNAINSAAAIARGDFLMKADGHCMFAEGFDEVLAANCESNWVVVPRRYRLDADNWRINPERPGALDYQYVCFPDSPNDFGGPTLTGRDWPEMGRQRRDVEIDELMTWQGSCWFMTQKYFHEMGDLEENLYGTFGKEITSSRTMRLLFCQFL